MSTLSKPSPARRSLHRLVRPQWVAYADRKPPKSVRLVIGGGMQYGKWSMSSPFPAHLMPGESGSCDADRTHWLAIPRAPKMRHNEVAHPRAGENNQTKKGE